MTPAQEKKLEVLLTQMTSALQEIALRKRQLVPHAQVWTSGAPIVIPDNVKSFGIANLGENGDYTVFDDITVTGITGITAIPKGIRTLEYSIENDQNEINGPVTVAGAVNHHVMIYYLL